MEKLSLAIGDHAVIAVPHLQELLAALHRRGYQVVDPRCVTAPLSMTS